MTRVDGVRRVMAQWWMLAGAASALMISCTRTAVINDLGEERDVRAELVAEAGSNYNFGPERIPVAVSDAVINGPGGVLPVITISTATRTEERGRAPTNKFIARITSSTAYPIMGFAPGVNYLWRDMASVADGGPYRTLVVPQNLTYPMMWLRRDGSVTSYSSLPAPEPRLVRSGLGFGVCDSGCSSGHCAARDTSGAFAVAQGPTVHIIAP